jgi:hypothetical protein
MPPAFDDFPKDMRVDALKITYVNDAYCALAGRGREELLATAFTLIGCYVDERLPARVVQDFGLRAVSRRDRGPDRVQVNVISERNSLARFSRPGAIANVLLLLLGQRARSAGAFGDSQNQRGHHIDQRLPVECNRDKFDRILACEPYPHEVPRDQVGQKMGAYRH